MSDTPTPRTEEVLRQNAASDQTPQEDYEALAVHAEMLERELAAERALPSNLLDVPAICDQRDKALEDLHRERALADRLAAWLDTLLAGYDDAKEIACFDGEEAHSASRALAAWKEARRDP